MYTLASQVWGAAGRRLRGFLIGLAAVVIAVFARPVDADAAFILGIADSEGDFFGHPYLVGGENNNPPPMGIIRFRTIVPYDVATLPDNHQRRIEFDQWIAAFLQFKAKNPQATFDVGLQRANEPRAAYGWAPTEQEYKTAFSAFLARYGQHRQYMRIGPWNEPNFNPKNGSRPRIHTTNPNQVIYLDESQGTPAAAPSAPCNTDPTVNNCGPRLAAYYWRWARSLCDDCFLEAGNFKGHQGYDYLQKYKHHLSTHQPDVWAVHNYSDVDRFMVPGDSSPGANDNSPAELKAMLGEIYCTSQSTGEVNLGPHHCGDYGTSAATGRLWITATGAWYTAACGEHPDLTSCPAGSYRTFGETAQCNAAAWMMRWTDIDSRIKRLYYFTYKDGNVNAPWNSDDTGLINAPQPGQTTGLPRKAYKVLKDKARACNY